MGLFDDRAKTDVKAFEFKERKGSKPRSVDFNRFATPSGKAEQLEGRPSSSKFVGPPSKPALEFTAEDVVNVREEAYRRGRMDADNDWVDRVEAAEEQVLAQAERTLEELKMFELAFAEQVQAIAVPLAQAFAENVLSSELQRPEVLEEMARSVIGHATGFSSVSVWVHPNTREALEDRRRKLRPEDPEGATIQLHEDTDLQPGDMRIVADGARIESIIAERLERLGELAQMTLRSVQSDEGDDDRDA